jgi:hypothetical protein
MEAIQRWNTSLRNMHWIASSFIIYIMKMANFLLSRSTNFLSRIASEIFFVMHELLQSN